MLRPVRDFQGVRKASELITGSQFEAPTTRSKATNLIYLQTMILIALEADNHGPATKRAQPGPPRALWLGAAVGLSYSMKLHINPPRGRFAPGDMDSDENLGRRNWCTLVILDRWHAVSTSSPLLIPDTSVVLLPEDQSLLGDSTFHLIRKHDPSKKTQARLMTRRSFVHRRPPRRTLRRPRRPHVPTLHQRPSNQQTPRRRNGAFPRIRRLHPRLSPPRPSRILAHPPSDEMPYPRVRTNRPARPRRNHSPNP